MPQVTTAFTYGYNCRSACVYAGPQRLWFCGLPLYGSFCLVILRLRVFTGLRCGCLVCSFDVYRVPCGCLRCGCVTISADACHYYLGYGWLVRVGRCTFLPALRFTVLPLPLLRRCMRFVYLVGYLHIHLRSCVHRGYCGVLLLGWFGFIYLRLVYGSRLRLSLRLSVTCGSIWLLRFAFIPVVRYSAGCGWIGYVCSAVLTFTWHVDLRLLRLTVVLPVYVPAIAYVLIPH